MVGRVVRVGNLSRESNKGGGCTGRGKSRPIEVRGQEGIDGTTERTGWTNKGSRLAGQHLGSIKSECLRTEVRGAGGVKDVHAHVIAVGPDAQVRIVVKVRAEMKAVTGITAGGVARRGNSNAFVGDGAGAGGFCKLRDEPAIGQVVVQDYGIAVAA